METVKIASQPIKSSYLDQPRRSGGSQHRATESARAAEKKHKAQTKIERKKSLKSLNSPQSTEGNPFTEPRPESIRLDRQSSIQTEISIEEEPLEEEDDEMSQPEASTSTAAPRPSITNVIMSPNDLQNIINHAVKSIVHERALENANTVAKDTSKDLKFATPKDFSGKPEDLDDFLNECNMIFMVKNLIYDNDTKKIVYALSFMKTGNADLWKRQYVQENFATDQDLTDTWEIFVRKIREAFRDVGQAEDAMLWLGQAKQGSMTIKQFNTLF